MIGLNRKSWITLAESQLNKRLKIFGKQANVCNGCLEILMCDGPVSFQICQTLDNMRDSGIVTGPKKTPWKRLRRKFLPITEDCLNAYGFKIQGNKLVKIGAKNDTLLSGKVGNNLQR